MALIQQAPDMEQLPAPTPRQFFIFQDDKQSGPFNEKTVRDMVATGAISQSVKAWHEGIDDWLPLNQIVEFPSGSGQPATTTGLGGKAILQHAKARLRGLDMAVMEIASGRPSPKVRAFRSAFILVIQEIIAIMGQGVAAACRWFVGLTNRGKVAFVTVVALVLVAFLSGLNRDASADGHIVVASDPLRKEMGTEEAVKSKQGERKPQDAKQPVYALDDKEKTKVQDKPVKEGLSNARSAVVGRRKLISISGQSGVALNKLKAFWFEQHDGELASIFPEAQDAAARQKKFCHLTNGDSSSADFSILLFLIFEVVACEWDAEIYRSQGDITASARMAENAKRERDAIPRYEAELIRRFARLDG